jgi:Arylsulfotransferase (ASST)
VLKRGCEAKFSPFWEGQVLVSLRNLDAVAVVDVETGQATWAAQGPWRSQHDAQFLDNGHLLLFDNLGAAPNNVLGVGEHWDRLPYHSRVLEIDPLTHAITWFYAGDAKSPFFNPKRCGQQRLPNGNPLILDSDGGRIIEATPEKKTVWEFAGPNDMALPQRHNVAFLTGARRYSEEELPFLKGKASARSRETPR